MKRYLLCELNDENYTDASFYFFYTKSMAINSAILDCVNYFDGNCEVETTDESYRICSRANGIYMEGFYVTEIKEIDEEKGTHILIWHHGYNGVDFEVRFQGTYEECEAKMKKEINEVRNNLTYSDEEIFENVVDTGDEWEVWDIVEIV